jgi:hypothetical protein
MKNRFSVLVHCWCLVLFCLAGSSCSKLSQWSVQTTNQVDANSVKHRVKNRMLPGDKPIYVDSSCPALTFRDEYLPVGWYYDDTGELIRGIGHARVSAAKIR